MRRNPQEQLNSHPKRNLFCAAVTAVSLSFTAGALFNAQRDREQIQIMQHDIALLTLAAQARENQPPRRAGEPIVIFDTAVLNFK